MAVRGERMASRDQTRIAIVGPCSAGKSTLASNLKARGFAAEDCGQEHSCVQTMWRRIANPDILIYLEVSLASLHARLKVDWEQAYLDEMNRRLTDARANAHYYVDTNPLTPQQVCDRVTQFLSSNKVSPSFEKE
jgi:deoxyadenosine/deoxycytidine kinase